MLQISALSPALVCEGLAGAQSLAAFSPFPADARSSSSGAHRQCLAVPRADEGGTDLWTG